MKGRPDSLLEIVDTVPNESKKWPYMDNLVGVAWSGAAVKEHEFLTAHADDCGPINSLSRRNDDIDDDVAWLALIAAPDKEKKGVFGESTVAIGDLSKATAIGTYLKECPWMSPGTGSDETAGA